MEATEDTVSGESMNEKPRVSKFNVSMKMSEAHKSLVPAILGISLAVVLFSLLWIFILKEPVMKMLYRVQPEEVRDVERPYYDGDIVVNPITGEKLPADEAKDWITSRPMGVMVNNYIDARPQSGLIYADIVYEIVAEGGITRFLAFFFSETPEKIGPVRSVRDYYLVLIKELGDAMIMHIGWSPQALEAIENWPVRSLARGGADFWRENPRNVATEHTAYVDGKELRKLSENLGWGGVGDFALWNYKDTKGKYDSYKDAVNLTIDFWYKGDYTGAFKYKPESNTYLRFTGYDANEELVPHKDQETDKQVEVKNVIVQYVAEVPIEGDDKNRLDYQLVGSGTGVVFLDGKAVEVTWTKEGRDLRTIYYDGEGQEMEFNRGKFWVCIVPDRNMDQVVYN